MNTAKDQRRDQRHLMKILKSNDYNGAKIMIKEKKIDLNFLDTRLHCSPLMLEAGRKKPPCIEMMQYLLDHGAIIDFRDSFGITALHLVMFNNTRRSCNACIIFLLSHGASPNLKNDKGDSPLHLACFSNNTNKVRCLLEFSNSHRDQSIKLQNEGMGDSTIQMIDVNCINDDGDTPLKLATEDNKVPVELVAILLQYKAEVNLVNKRNFSALNYASRHETSKVVDLLLHHGADVNIVDDEDWTPLERACYRGKDVSTVQSLLTFHADVNRQNRQGRTVLHLLVGITCDFSFYLIENCFKLLLANGANVHIQDHVGKTPFFDAVLCCRNGASDSQQNAMKRLIELLIDEKSDINIQVSNDFCNLINGDSILHCAIKSMNFWLLDLILGYGPDLHLRNCLQETPRDVAIKTLKQFKGCTAYLELINEKMATIRIQSYSYLFQSWAMPDGELEQLHRKEHHGMTHAPCLVPTKKCRHT